MSRKRTTAKQLTNNEFIKNLGDILSRADLAQRFGTAFEGNRDYNLVFGYKRALEYQDYLAWYRRGGIAKSLIHLPRDTCWRYDPDIREDDDTKSNTPFEKAVLLLQKKLAFFANCYRADVLAGIGRYSVILIGVNVGIPLDQPLPDGVLRSINNITYLQPYSEANAQIVEYVIDPEDDNFTKPKTYRINIGNPNSTTGGGGSLGLTSPGSRLHLVHASRVIHIAEGTLEDDVFGTPDLESPFNILMDILKVSGGAAEIFWLNARNGLKGKIDKDFGMSDPDKEALLDTMEKFTNQLNRVVLADGVDISTLLNNQPIDPRGAFAVLIDQLAASAKIPIPKRLLLGADQGERASTQDRVIYAERMQGRQAKFCEPGIIRKAVERFIALGAVPLPTSGDFRTVWKPLIELDEKERAQIAINRANAIKSYLAEPNAQLVVSPAEFRQLLDLDSEMTPEEKASILPELKQQALPPPSSTPAVVTNAEVVEPEVTREELHRFEDRIMGALQSFAASMNSQQNTNVAPSFLQSLVQRNPSADIKEQLTALTQQVQTALLHSASDTQLNALAQRVDQVLQQLTALSSREPATTATPTFNVTMPEATKTPSLYVTLPQPLEYEETFERDPQTLEMKKVLGKVTKMSEGKVEAVTTNGQPQIHIVPQPQLNYKKTPVTDEKGELVKIIREAID